MNSPSNEPIERFRELLDSHGSDLSRWPLGCRDDMQQLLQQSALAQQALREATVLDQLMALDQPPAPALALRRQLLQSHASAGVGWRSRWALVWRELGGLRLAAPALTAALAMGIALGSWVLPVDAVASDSSGDLLTLVQYNLDDTELESP